MDSMSVFFIMVGICALVLLIGLLKRRAAVLLNFIVRIIVGCVAIVITNQFLQNHGIPVAAGLNPLNILTVGTLGSGGFALIYGILLYGLL